MQDELKKQKVSLTLEHPQAEGGKQTYCTEDGWEMILMVGRKEGDGYQMHRMLMSGPGLVSELMKSFIEEFPEIARPIIMDLILNDLKGRIGKKKQPKPSTNKDEPPPGTTFN